MDSEIFLLLCLFVSQSVTLDFEFDDREDISYRKETDVLYFADMHEEIRVPFSLGAFVNTGPVAFGYSILVGPPKSNIEINFTDTGELNINVLQDYEASIFVYQYPLRQYGVRATAGTEFIDIYLSVLNINDNPPLIQANNPSCEIKENFVGPTDCFYTITDLDGVFEDFELNLIGNGNEFFSLEHSIEGDELTVRLEVIKELDYETATLHIMELVVRDTPIQQGDPIFESKARVVVEVIDVADEPPKWISIFASEEFDELTSQVFHVSARDGDLGVNDDIIYKITETRWGNYITVDESTGEINVEPIDRDKENEQMFSFNIVACEVNIPNECITQSITFLVTDINNKKPEITISSESITINENFYGDLDVTISVTDLDMGPNAMYDITLTSAQGGVQHTDAFTVAPSAGYQTTNIYMYVTDYQLLDYENEDWREFTLTIETMDFTDPYNTDSAQVTIKLINLNDEIPEFKEMQGDAYRIAIDETISADQFLLRVVAEDRDVDDKVTYALLGTYINSILAIDEEGRITTKINGALDYETQEEVILQVQATDSLAEPFNSAIAQVIISVNDINDETPRITVGSDRVQIDENLKDGTAIVSAASEYIIATDDDKDAILEFSIDWTNTYATKTGVRKDDEFEKYEGCITISGEEISNNGGKGKAAVAKLYIEEVILDNTPDYELFDTIYLNVVVTDKDQDPVVAENKASVIVPIYIQDVNDVSPVFTQSTIDSVKRVSENAQNDTTIAIIIATDEDSQDIMYSIRPLDDDHKNLVEIDEFGRIYVVGDIDADEPPLYNMQFTVTASDGETPPATATITIEVLDENDNSPIFDKPAPNEYFEVEEQADDGTFITTLHATDADRDAINNEITYKFSTTTLSDLRNYFGISADEFVVQYQTPDGKLDRDNGIPGVVNTIIVEAIDGNMNDPKTSEPLIFHVRLTDINNNAPIITTTEFGTNENVKTGGRIGEVQAEDADEENSPNTRIHFEIISTIAEVGKDPPYNLFVLNTAQPGTDKVNLVAGIDLEGYFGTYKIDIRTYDEGTNPGPQEHINTITVEIDKYNFYEPQFDIKDGTKLLLRKDQVLNFQLYQYNDVLLPDIFATDQQGDKYSIDFSIVDSDVFTIITRNRGQAQLQLKAEPATNIIDPVTIAAQAIDAFPVLRKEINIIVEFVDLNEPPIFTQSTETIYFKENTTGLNHDFQEAIFNNIPEELVGEFVVYYIIHGENEGGFRIEDNTVNKIGITNVLDREEISSYTIQIQSSPTADGVAIPQSESILRLTIEVEDINDNPPNFSANRYFGRISSTFASGTSILFLQATDLDSEAKLTYSITSYDDTPDFINSDEPFIVNRTSGQITNSITVLDNAEGYFLFTVEVSDGEYSDEATVHVYIMSDKHKVEFVFKNDIETISNAQNEILRVLEQEFNYTCIVDQIIQNTNADGQPLADETIFRVHFVNLELNKPVLKDDIQIYANDIQMFGNLQAEFQRYTLTLVSFLETSGTTDDMEAVLRAWLIGLTVVLGTLCVLLLVAFILKTRSLSKRLNKLSVIRYGSQESVSNRRQAPTTNKHAIEGSNPAYNEDKIKSPENEDTVSIDSGESDLVGVENNPEFDYKYEKQG